MIPRPPSSTLFPTRRSSDLVQPQRTPSRPTRPRLAMQASLLQSFPGQGMPTSGLFSRNLKKAFPLAIRGEGCWIVDESGRRFLDAAGQAAVVSIEIGRAHV